MTGTRQLHFFLCPWCLLLEDLYYMAKLTNIFLMHFFSRNNIFFQYLSISFKYFLCQHLDRGDLNRLGRPAY